jgi:spermidine synthase
VSLYKVGGQGIIVASMQPQTLPLSTATAALLSRPKLMELFNQVNMRPGELEKNLILTTNDVDHLVSLYERSSDALISNDDNLYLEFSTPKGNALDSQKSVLVMTRFLNQFSSTYQPGQSGQQ